MLLMNQEKKEKRYCTYEHCPSPKRALPPVGDARQNGKAHKDWDLRTMHKKCYKDHLNDKNSLLYMLDHKK